VIRYHAPWVLPISGPPIRDGWVSVDRDRIVACGADTDRAPRDESRDVVLGRAVIMPGLVNAHTHLELSYLHGQVPAGSSFAAWIRSIIAARRQRVDPNAPEILAAVDRAIANALRAGTAVIGEISNTLVTFASLVRSPLAAVAFHELIGFNLSDPAAIVARAEEGIEALRGTDRVRASLAAHAPYSVAPALFRAIREAMNRRPFAPCSVHLAESADETEFVRTGGGAWRGLLEDVGAWNPAWVAPAVSPVEYLDRSGFLWRRLLVVHGVQMTSSDLGLLAACGATIVTCPRSNQYTGAGRPPIDAFYRSGVRVAIGTDSLASTPDLNVFAELAAMRALAPSVPASLLLESATRGGARALAFDADFGTIESGKAARLIIVDVPTGIDDVEEYLVSGIEPEQVRWIQS
jgi:aminodeoxyfutalosine deaminase